LFILPKITIFQSLDILSKHLSNYVIRFWELSSWVSWDMFNLNLSSKSWMKYTGTSFNWTCMEGQVNLKCIVLFEWLLQHFSTYSHVLFLPHEGIHILAKLYIWSNLISFIYSVWCIFIYFPVGRHHYTMDSTQYTFNHIITDVHFTRVYYIREKF
jgi:hypothetical protein